MLMKEKSLALSTMIDSVAIKDPLIYTLVSSVFKDVECQFTTLFNFFCNSNNPLLELIFATGQFVVD